MQYQDVLNELNDGLSQLVEKYLPGLQIDSFLDLVELVKIFGMKDPDSYLRSSSLMKLQNENMSVLAFFLHPGTSKRFL